MRERFQEVSGAREGGGVTKLKRERKYENACPFVCMCTCLYVRPFVGLSLSVSHHLPVRLSTGRGGGEGRKWGVGGGGRMGCTCMRAFA